MPYTIPPDTRAVGTPDPPGDVNNIADVLTGNSVIRYNVLSTAYSGGADRTGIADSTTPIQAALNAATPGSTVWLPTGVYTTSLPLSVPTGVTFAGEHGRTANGTTGGPVITPSASFTGSQVIGLAAGQEQELSGFTLDCSALSPAAAIDGIAMTDTAVNGYIHDVMIRYAPRGGFSVGNGTHSGTPGSWRMRRVTVDHTGNGAAFNVANMVDSTWTDCYTLAAAGQGWYVYGNGNCTFLGCRAEWSGNFGWQIDGNAGLGIRMTGCSTDRSTQHGVLITATSNDPIVITGMVCHRDGAGSVSGGYAGITIASNVTNPVIVDGCAVYPGVNDDSTGNDSPQYGMSVGTGVTYVAVSNTLLHGVTAGTNGTITNYRALATRTGSITSPSAITLVADSA